MGHALRAAALHPGVCLSSRSHRVCWKNPAAKFRFLVLISDGKAAPYRVYDFCEGSWRGLMVEDLCLWWRSGVRGWTPCLESDGGHERKF